MKTRHADLNADFRQERYMSSAALDRGLLANCVASRLRVVGEPEWRKLIWWLQLASHRAGDIEGIAAEIIERWPERFGTEGMHRIGMQRDRAYTASEVTELREELPYSSEGREMLGGGGIEDLLDRPTRPARANPYRVSELREACLDAARRGLGDFLFKELCLNPSERIDSLALWYLPDLEGALRDAHAAYVVRQGRRAATVVTSVGQRVGDALDYAQECRGLVIVDGVARIGKTFAAKAWCEARPGQARYIQVPSSNDDMSFFRAIAESLGMGASRAYKALELRAQVEDVLQGGDLIPVFDEGHYLWPQRNMRKAVTHGINWILTQLVNMGVPVAIVTTPHSRRVRSW